MKVQVAIIGGGPSGLLLSLLLARAGIETAIIERHTKDYVLKRIRAGVLEWGSVELLRSAGIGARMDKEGFVHEGTFFAAQNQQFRVDFTRACGRPVMVYGQTEITKDLYGEHARLGTRIYEEADGVELHGLQDANASVSFMQNGQRQRITCDYVAGCDGFHGVSRQVIPLGIRKEFERVYPFGWWACCPRPRRFRMN